MGLRQAGVATMKWTVKVLVAAIVSVIIATQILSMFTEALQLTSPNQKEFERRKRATFFTFTALCFTLIMAGALFFTQEIKHEVISVMRNREDMVDRLVQRL